MEEVEIRNTNTNFVEQYSFSPFFFDFMFFWLTNVLILSWSEFVLLWSDGRSEQKKSRHTSNCAVKLITKYDRGIWKNFFVGTKIMAPIGIEIQISRAPTNQFERHMYVTIYYNAGVAYQIRSVIHSLA